MLPTTNSDYERTDPNVSLVELTKGLLEGAHENSSRFKQVFALRNVLDEETDRGCALMIGAYLDNL